MRIHISTPIDEAARIVAMFQEALPDAHIALVDGGARNSSDPGGADYVVTGYRNATLFDRERRMKAIFAFSAGVVTAVNFGVGDRVPEGADLVDLDESSS